jgi:hypothetical protein
VQVSLIQLGSEFRVRRSPGSEFGVPDLMFWFLLTSEFCLLNSVRRLANQFLQGVNDGSNRLIGLCKETLN